MLEGAFREIKPHGTSAPGRPVEGIEQINGLIEA
jgi:hypothetical protein